MMESDKDVTGIDFDNIMGVLAMNDLKAHHWTSINKLVLNKQLILQTLQEYPKLQEQYDYAIKTIHTLNDDKGKLQSEVKALEDKYVQLTKLKIALAESHDQFMEIVETCNKMKEENEDLQMKLDGDAVTFMNMQKEILDLKEQLGKINYPELIEENNQLKQLKQRLDNLIDTANPVVEVFTVSDLAKLRDGDQNEC